MNRLTQPNLEPVQSFETPESGVEDAPRARSDQPDLRRATKCVPDGSPLDNLKSVVLLAGSVGPSTFRSALGRAMVELPVERARTILSDWSDHCVALARSAGIKGLAVRVLVDQAGHLPGDPSAENSAVRLTIERDPSELRGTGGLLRDIAEDYGDDDWLLVANAIQLLRTPLAQLAGNMAARSAPVVVVSHDDGTPSGVMLVRCGCLRELPDIGFVDMKEQGLGIIARRHTVKVLGCEKPTGYPIRTYVNYLSALRRFHVESGLARGPVEDWESCFSLVEPGAEVSAGATVHDSVVLRGGRVEKGAVVINSVVCAGGVVRRGQTVVDELVAAAGRR